MADITMCKGVFADKSECKMRENCYRYLATPHPKWQSWFADIPRTDNCKIQWKVTKK